jgi:AraC-like DNA-binding protein
MNTVSRSLASAKFMNMVPATACTFIETSDPLVVNDRFSREFAPHRLEVAADARPFAALAHKARLANSLMYLSSCSVGLKIITQPVGENFIFYMPLRGRIELTRESGSTNVGPGQIAAVNPNEKYSLAKADNCRILTLKVRRADIDRQARELSDGHFDKGWHFDTARPIQLERRPALVQILETAYAEIFSERSIFSDPRYCEPLETLLIRLLLCQAVDDDNCREVPAHYRAGPVPYYMIRVEHAVAADARRDWTIAELAEISGVSARSLFASFKQFRGTSPVRYVKTQKLERIRLELLACGAGRDERRTVTSIAYDWGFYHMGDFSAAYRKRFGELPSETMRKQHDV